MIDESIRSQTFLWLREQVRENDVVLSRRQLEDGFSYQGHNIHLVGPSGIWKPKDCELPLSITSIVDGPYPDDLREDGFLLYKYRGTDPHHRDNVGLRNAMRTRTPLVLFYCVMPNRYLPVWPVFIAGDDPENLTFLVAVDPAYATGGSTAFGFDDNLTSDSAVGIRRYVAAIMNRRLHQTSFRERVVAAYDGTCVLCRLRHRELLDAAHIIPDSQSGGDPIVQNGLCLCKIHHAAYDTNIIGISPDYTAHIRPDILDESDGPMLQHGLQRLENTKIVLPKRRSMLPDRDRLDRRFQEFLKVG